MTRRIALWALAGLLVAVGWVIVARYSPSNVNLARWTVVTITAPASYLGRKMPLGMYSFIAMNAAIYALVGGSVELARRAFAGAR